MKRPTFIIQDNHRNGDIGFYMCYSNTCDLILSITVAVWRIKYKS